MGHLGLHLSDQIGLGLLGGEAGNPLQHLRLAALDDFDLLVFLVDGRMLLGQGLLSLLQSLGLAVEVLFPLLQAVFLPLQVGSARLLFLLVLAAVLKISSLASSSASFFLVSALLMASLIMRFPSSSALEISFSETFFR